MHGMLSAAIVIGAFAVTAAACLYVAVRVYLAGTRPGRAAGPGQAFPGQAFPGQASSGQAGSAWAWSGQAETTGQDGS
ncbi:MAG: hypothetical protein M3Z75_13995 [Actinomycetota bacterium]|nr:hypothetical protein [Actinomycetota bacterium]